MSDISTDIQVWFLRHGRTPFDYESSAYDEFIEMLCNGQSTPLAEDPGIDFDSLPKQVDFIAYSPATRAAETAEVLRKELAVKKMEKLEPLREVGFSKDIIREHEFESLEQIRRVILERWLQNGNRAEGFKDSLDRVKEIELFLSQRQEETIILVTHGWFLRLLEIYFVQGKRKHTDITIKDILEVKPVALGHSIKATVARKDSSKS